MAVKVFVKTIWGTTLTFFFPEEQFLSSTVLQLKEKIRETEGIPEDQQRVIVKGRQLEDQRLLSDGGVKHESTIHLVVRRRQTYSTVFVKTLTGKNLTISFAEEEFKRITVEELKMRIRDTEGIPEDIQRLIFTNMQLIDHLTLDDYGVNPGDTIHLVLSIRGGYLEEEKEEEKEEEEDDDEDEDEEEEPPGSGDGGMGDREGRNLSMERLADFSKCTVC